MPAANYDLMLQEMLNKTEGTINEVIYLGRPLDWHNQTLTPNPETLYFLAFLNTKIGRCRRESSVSHQLVFAESP